MTCNISACNAKIQARIDKLRKNEEFTRTELYDNLSSLMGSLYWVAAPTDIPDRCNWVRTPYGPIMVLHLDMRVCTDQNGVQEYTDNVDWAGVQEGEWITNKGYIIAKVKETISDDMAAQPIGKIRNQDLITFNYLGTEKAKWHYVEGYLHTRTSAKGMEMEKQIFSRGYSKGFDVPQFTDMTTPLTDDLMNEYKTLLEKVRELGAKLGVE